MQQFWEEWDSRWEGLKDVDVVPSYSVSGGEGVVSRGRLYFVEGLIIGVVESVAVFVFLHAVGERSVSLSIVGRVAVQAEEFRKRGQEER